MADKDQSSEEWWREESKDGSPQPSDAGPTDDGEQSRQQDAAIKARRIEMLEKCKAVFPDQAAKIERAANTLQQSLLYYVSNREGIDPELLDLVGQLIQELSRALFCGDSGLPIPKVRKDELRAALIGAAMVVDPGHGRSFVQSHPSEHVRYAKQFLDLVAEKVGRVEADGKATIKMRVDDYQEGMTVTYRKEGDEHVTGFQPSASWRRRPN